MACPHQEEFAAFPSPLCGYFLKILPVFKEPEIICIGLWQGWRKVYPTVLLTSPFPPWLKALCQPSFELSALNSLWAGPMYSEVSDGLWEAADNTEKLSSTPLTPEGKGFWTLHKVAASRRVLDFPMYYSQWEQYGRLLGTVCFLFLASFFRFFLTLCNHGDLRWWDGTTFSTPLKTYPSLRKIMQLHVFGIFKSTRHCYQSLSFVWKFLPST